MTTAINRTHIIKECDDAIIEILSNEGDIFIDEDIRIFQEQKRTLLSSAKLMDIHKHIMYIRDQIQFAILFQAFLVALVRIFKPTRAEQFNKLTRDQFITKNRNFIEQIWYWIVYYNLWYIIRFIASTIVALVQSD